MQVVSQRMLEAVPKLWTETIEAHRQAVRDATLDTVAALVGMHGLASVTMSRIAEETGIGRATLYKYFPDVESILLAWHERHVTQHLDRLVAIAYEVGDPRRRLHAVLEAYAVMQHETHQHAGTEFAASLHRGGQVADAEKRLNGFLRGLVADSAAAGGVRADVTPEELAAYCLHALGAARGLASSAAVRRLVGLVLDGLGRAPAPG